MKSQGFPVENNLGADALANRLQDVGRAPKPSGVVKTLTYDVELITPLFGGGVEAGVNDLEMPIRAKALRGQLRFWWRLLAANGAFATQGVAAALNGRDLYEAETSRWGGAQPNGTPQASRIQVHIITSAKTVKAPLPFEIQGKDGKWRPNNSFGGREIGYGLFPAKYDNDRKSPLSLMPAGLMFTLELTVCQRNHPTTDQLVVELQKTIEWWATFGGVGARWRRGAGAVRVRDAKRILCVIPAQATSKLLALPKYPGMYMAICPSVRNASQAWQTAVSKLQTFRQVPGIGRAGTPTAQGRSYWPEPDLVRDRFPAADGIFRKHQVRHAWKDWAPRAAFGMPLGIRFPPKQQSQNGEPRGAELVPVTSSGAPSRMASPVIVRAVALPDGNSFAPCALLLPHWRSVLGMSVELKGHPTLKVGGIWPGSSVDQASAAAAIKPIGGTGKQDPLSAFMKFFTK